MTFTEAMLTRVQDDLREAHRLIKEATADLAHGKQGPQTLDKVIRGGVKIGLNIDDIGAVLADLQQEKARTKGVAA